MSAIALPTKIQSSPGVQRLLGQLSSARRSNSLLRREAEQAMTPAVVTAATQAGAATQGALMAYLAPGRVPMASLSVGLISILGGSVYGSPEAVAYGNGVIAPLTSLKVAEFLTRPSTNNSTRE